MSRAVRRHHRRRVNAKRTMLYRQIYAWWPSALDVPAHQMRLGCGNARCGICHPHKLDHLDRRHAERGWRTFEEDARGGPG